MGAESSTAQRDEKSQEEDASAKELSSAEVTATATEGGSVVVDPAKPLQKNGQISSMSSLNDHSEDNTLTEVGQTESVSAAPKEEAAETMGTIQNEVAPHVNGEKEQKECPNGSEITAAEEKAAEEKPGETNEVGFKKIFRFAGFKFTLKKDKSEEKNPVKLLTVKDKEEKQASKAETDATAGEEVTAKETEVKVTEATEEAATSEVPAEEATAAESKDEGEQVAESSPPPPEAESAPAPPEPESAPAPPEPESAPAPPEPESAPAPPEPESAPAPPEAESAPAPPEAESTPAAAEAESTPAEAESTPAAPEAESDPAAPEAEDSTAAQEGESSPTSEEAKSSPSVQEAILSPFRKLFTGGLFSNLRKKNSIKEQKEKEAEGEAAEAEETAQAEAVVEDEKAGAQQEEVKEEAPASTPEEVKPEAEVVEVTAAPDTTDEPKLAEEAKPEEEVASAEVATEAEILSSQEKAKAQGSPLKKLFTGAGLKKLSTKKSKPKKDAESKPETGEQTAEQLQSSTEAAEECKKPESGASSPEDSGEHVIAEDALQAEQNQEVEGEVTSDSEKKKEGIIPWSSFKKMVTPKRRVKKASDSEDEATAEKAEKPAKSATLSSTESAVFTEKGNEEEVKEEKEDKPTEEEPQTETTEKLEGSTEESKKKMDTSVSWEALMCMGGAKKRTRKTSDSDDDETKIEEETPAAEGGEEPESKPTETAEVTTQETETEGAEGEVVPEPEPVSNPPERETAWAILKRFVMPKLKAKTDEKTEENAEQTVSETEMPKEESAFSLRKFLPGRRKKKVEKQSSTEVEEDSDTPAVVPLSEYDAEPAKNEEEPPVEAAITQTKVSAEDRSPSWIPATVEDDDKQLSDIPEEAENAATPKSADTTIAEDVIEKLSTAEVKTQPELPVTDTTPIEALKSETAEMVLEAAADQVSVIPCQTAVTVEDSPVFVATAETEHEPPTEQADSETKTILEAHELKDAVRICTGLGTKEIAKVKSEKPLDATVESVPETTDPVCTMLPVEEKPPKSETPIVTELPVFVAEVNQVYTTEHTEPAVEKTDTVIETATESEEPDIEIVAVVSSLPQQSEAVQPSEVSENSPKVAIVSPITPTVEAIVCTESVEVIEPDVETKEIEVAVEVAAAIEENAPLKEIAQAVSQEIISAIPDTLTNTTTEVSETAIPVAVPVEEVAVIHEAAAPVTPLSENVEQLETKDETAMENVPILETVGDEPIQVQETTTTMTTVVESEVNDSISAATYEVSTSVVEPTASVVDTEPEVKQVDAIEEQSMVIAQAVIKHAMTEVKEAEPEHKNPTTSTADVQSPVQALSTTEENVELQTEEAVITDTPVPVTHETSAPVETPKSPGPLHAATEVMGSAVLEVAESIDAPTDGESKSAEGLEEAVEVEEREAIVLAEEVVELNTESQPSGNLEEDQSKVVPEDVKETSEEVIPKPEETKAEETKAEETKAEETKAEETKAEEHKAEEPKAEEPKAEEPKAEEIKAEETKAEETKAEETMAPETNAEVTKADDTKAEETNTEETKADETTAEAPAEEKKEEIPEIHIPTQVVLQEAHVVENPMATEESVAEFDSNGPVNDTEPAKETELNADSSCDEKPESDQLPTQPEEIQTNASTEPATSSQEVPAAATATSLAETEVVSSSGKCAEVMAQVIEVIEEAVKEIEPVSTELTAAS